MSWAEEAALFSGTWLPLEDIPVEEPAETLSTQGHAWVMGAHGGAGTSTISGLTGLLDAGRKWPVGSPRPEVWIACSTSYSGYLAARAVARQWHSGKVQANLAGLVIVQASPKEHKELRQLKTDVSGAFPDVVFIPWIQALRIRPVESYRPSIGIRRRLEKLYGAALVNG